METKFQDLSNADLSSARRIARALAVAARMKDAAAWMVNAVRMHCALERANASLGVSYSARDIARATELYALTVKTRTLRETAPTRLRDADSDRAMRWDQARTSHRSSGAHADLFECEANEASGISLAFSSFARLFLLRCRFERAGLSGANFDDTVLDGCVLNDAVASASHWSSAQLVACQLVGCDLTDASLGYALFVDCDLRDADLSEVRRADPQSIAGAIFVRCDLRGSKWDGRRLHNVTFSECRMHDVRGRPNLDGVRIVSPNLSPDDDGCSAGTAMEVAALWGGEHFIPPAAHCADQKDLQRCAISPENGLDGTALGSSLLQQSSLRGVRQ